MKILLIRPPVPPHTIGLKHIMICEPLELEYVAAGLKGHDIQIFDGILESGIEKRIRGFNPDIVGTSCYITGVNEVIKICRYVKSWNEDCVTVVGGVHASQVPEDFSDKSIDCIVLGDGTSVMPDVVKAIEQGNSLRNIAGLAFPTDDNDVEFTETRNYMPHPDELPFPRRDLVKHLTSQYYYMFHQPVATVKTTWGCWYKCNFCFTWRITDGNPYSRSPESIADELAQIDAEDIYIVDDIFLINKTRLSKIAKLLTERGIKKNYLVYARADFISENEDIIKEWAKLGLKAVFIGLEASTNLELGTMEKGTTVDHNRNAIEVLRRHGVDTYGSLITQPHYLPEDWKRLRQFIEDTGLYYLNISPLTPLPGTLIWEKYKDKITVDRAAHGLWDLSHILLPTRMPIKDYYRSLLRVYAESILDIRRANRLTLRTRPPIWSFKYLRLWTGAVKIFFQFMRAHTHHEAKEIQRAMYKGPDPYCKPKEYNNKSKKISLFTDRTY